MAMQLVDGDYVSDERGGFGKVIGTDAVMQRILLKLKARRGEFPLMPEFGSRLYLLPREKSSAWQRAAEQYVSEALADERDVEILKVFVEEEDANLKVMVEVDVGGEVVALSMNV